MLSVAAWSQFVAGLSRRLFSGVGLALVLWLAGRFCTAHDKIMAALREYLPTKLPPIKTLIMPLGLIAAVFPTMSAYEWGTTACWMLLAIWIGSVATEKMENSEWRKKLREDADKASRQRELAAEKAKGKSAKKQE